MHPYALQTETFDTAQREQLIMDQLPQVHLIARRFHERLPHNVSLDDLISSGIIGLIAAIDNFDPNHGVKLKTYAEHKIRGAILDSLRDLDWASRHRRKKAKDIESAISAAEQKLHRAPTEEEVAQQMGLTLHQYQERLMEVQGLNLESLDLKIGPNGKQALITMVPDTEEPSPAQCLERAELERLLAEAIDRMPETERTILSLYYREELTLREIAKILDVQISRVSELKSQAIMRLRAQMRVRWPGALSQ